MELAHHTRALELLGQSIDIATAALGPEHPAVAGYVTTLGDALRRSGAPAEALAKHQLALMRFEASFGPDHPQLVDVLNNLGVAYRDLGRSDEALAAYQRALTINEAAFGPTHGATGTAVNNIAIILLESGRPNEARPHYERALAIAIENGGPDHPRAAIGHHNLASLERELSNYAAAIPHSERAVAIFSDTYGPAHPNTSTARVGLAEALRGAGELERARQLYERASADAERRPPRDRAYTNFRYGRLRYELGEVQAGIELVLAARSTLATEGEGARDELTLVTQWLREHAPQALPESGPNGARAKSNADALRHRSIAPPDPRD